MTGARSSVSPKSFVLAALGVKSDTGSLILLNVRNTMETVTERDWYEKGICLERLAELDDCPSPGALADVVGDRYLCRHNPIFANIRAAALRAGYRFSAEDNLLWRDYQSCALLTLPQILSGRIIPYHDTGNTFLRLRERYPDAAPPPFFILGNLKRNYVFHEAAHCVAHSVLKSGEFVLDAMFAESFANTVERLGAAFHGMSIPDIVFYPLNSYIAPEPQTTTLLEKAGEDAGSFLRFALLFLGSFEANLAAGGLEQSAFERIVRAIDCPAGQEGLAREIVSLAFSLNAGFRNNTTPTYFEFLGCRREYTCLTKSGWLGIPGNRNLIRDVISTLFETATANA